MTHHLGKCCKQAYALFSKEHNPRAPRFQRGGRDRGVAGMFIRYIVHCHVPNPVGTLRKFVHCAMYNVPTFARGGLQCTNVPTLRASVLQRFLIPVESLWEELELFVHCPSRFGTLPCTMYQLLRRAHWAFSGLKENVRGTPCAVGTLFASQCTMYQRTNVRTFARQALKCTNVRSFSKLLKHSYERSGSL